MQKTIPIPSRDQVTQLQVGTVLSAMATLIPFFRIDDESWKGGANDGGSKCAVEVTLINLCDRLDKIITDDSRWDMGHQHSLENHLANLYTEHAKTLKLQQQQLYYMARPSARHNPSLYRMVDGSWLAMLGRLEDIDNAVVGVGGSPEQALEAFDEMFKGNIPTHLQAWMAVREEAIRNNLQPPTKEDYDKSKNVDRTGRPEAASDEGGGSPLQEDSSGTWPDSEVGGDSGEPPSASGPGYDFGDENPSGFRPDRSGPR